MPGSYFPEETGAADQDDNQTPPYKCSLVELFRAEAVAVSLDTLNKEPIQFTHSSAWVLEATRTTTESKLKELETSKCIWQNAHTQMPTEAGAPLDAAAIAHVPQLCLPSPHCSLHCVVCLK